MNFARSILKVFVGLAVFASLMLLEFTSYTRAVAEAVDEETVVNSKKVEVGATVKTNKNRLPVVR